MNVISEKSTTVSPSTAKYTPHHRLRRYFEELDKNRKPSLNGPNKINNSGDDEPPRGDNNKYGITDIPRKNNSGLLTAFIASTILAIGTNKLKAFAAFGERISDFINASLGGLSLSLGVVTLTKYLTDALPEQIIDKSPKKAVTSKSYSDYSLN